MATDLGNTEALSNHIIPFSAVLTVRGPKGYGHIDLVEVSGFKLYIQPYASAILSTSSLSVAIVCPAQADKVAFANVAVVPDSCTSWPTSDLHIFKIAGHARVQHSALNPSTSAILGFATGVNTIVKPIPHFGSAPTLVYTYNLVGADEDTQAHIILNGTVTVQGVGFMQPW